MPTEVALTQLAHINACARMGFQEMERVVQVSKGCPRQLDTHANVPEDGFRVGTRNVGQTNGYKCTFKV